MFKALPKLAIARQSTTLLARTFGCSNKSPPLIKGESVVKPENTKQLQLQSLTEQLKISTMRYTTLFQNKIATEARGSVLYMRELEELDHLKSKCDQLEKEVTSLHHDIFNKRP